MKRGIQYGRLSVVVAILALCGMSLHAATLHVARDGAAEFPTVQAAVTAAADGDTIVLDPGTYTGPGNCDIDLHGKSLHIQSVDPLDPAVVAGTVIDCAGEPEDPHRGFYVVGCDGATLSGLTITHGLATAGGAVYCRNSTLTLENCRLVSNAALPGDAQYPAGGPGGGLYCEGSLVKVVRCLIDGNVAGDGAARAGGPGGPGGAGGGLCCVMSRIEIEASTIVNNVAGSGGVGKPAGPGGDGGGICGGFVLVKGGTISQNVAGGRGGALCAEAAVIRECIIEANGGGSEEAETSVWIQGDRSVQDQSWGFDAGDPLATVGADEEELDGSPRLAAAAVDIGADGSEGLVPVFRFWSPVSGKHFFTINEEERDMLIRDYAYFWNYEGIAYYVYASSVDPALKPVYRFWSTTLVSHFYTIDEAEKDMLIRDYPYVWTFEGIAFYAYPEDGQPAGTDAVYRFWSDVYGGHFYTIDPAERDVLVRDYSYVWTLEGVAWYAVKDANDVEPEEGGYEFTGGATEASCTATLKAYVDGVEAQIDKPVVTFVPEVALLRMTVDFDTMVATIKDIVMETKFTQHTTTIRGGAGGDVVIPMTLSGAMIFWGATPRGPYAINPQTLAFPMSSNVLAGGNETFSLAGSVTVDGSKINTGVAVRATRFSEGQGVFDDAGMPDLLDLNMAEPFQWSRSQHEDRLIQTTVNGHQLLLYVVSAQVRTKGLWHGKPAE